MALGEAVLQKKAKKLELQGIEKNKITTARVSDVDELLNDVYVICRPNPIDYHNRRDLVRIFNAIAKEIYGNSDDSPVVEGFGSFFMDIFNAGSDLDLSVNFGNNAVEFPREKKIKTLRKFAKKLYSLQREGHVTGIQTITSARVPIVKVIDRGTGVECDLSVENRDGIAKSQIVHMISAIDKRFQKLSFLMKAWAKAHDINSSKDRTLNSLSIISLVAFHLQTRDPPILPPFSTLFKDGIDPAIVMKVVSNYMNYGKRNEESVAELFISLFVKLASVEKLWHKGLCASLYEGSWISKAWNSQIGSISVEDFTDRSQNVARAVGMKEVKKIYSCIHCSLRYLLAFLDGQMQGPKLRELLFDKGTISTLGDIATMNIGKNKGKVPLPPNLFQTKKMRLSEGWRGKQQVNGWEIQQHVESWGGKQQVDGWGGNQHMEGWGGKLQVDGWGGRQHMEGWGGKQQAYFDTVGNMAAQFTPPVVPYQTPLVASTLENKVCRGPVELPSLPTRNPIGLEGSYGPLQHPPFVSPPNSLGFNVSHLPNPNVPMSYETPNSLGFNVSHFPNPNVPMPYFGPNYVQQVQTSNNLYPAVELPTHLFKTG